MSHLSSIKSHCDMRMYTEQSRFQSSDSTLRKSWSKDRIRRDFRVFRTERSRIASFAKKRSDEKAYSFEVDSSDEDVKVSIVYSTCIASRASTRLRREKELKHCEKNTFTILARKRIRDAMKSSSRRILIVDASNERERWSWENSDTRENFVISKVVIVLFDDSRSDESWTLLFSFARDISSLSAWLS
jgi:hypothetical protein